MFNLLAGKYSLEAVYVFGSLAKEVQAFVAGDMTSLSDSVSDVDIGVKPASSTRLSVSQEVELAQELEDFFNVPRVDLLVIPEVDPFVAANIIQVSKNGSKVIRSWWIGRSEIQFKQPDQSRGLTRYHNRQMIGGSLRGGIRR